MCVCVCVCVCVEGGEKGVAWRTGDGGSVNSGPHKGLLKGSREMLDYY